MHDKRSDDMKIFWDVLMQYCWLGSRLAYSIKSEAQKPRDDLITNLIKAQVEGRHLSNNEILTFCRLLLLAGHVTTVNLIGNTILSLLQNQAEFRLLQDDQNLIPSRPLSYHILQNLYLLFVRIETRLVALKNGRSCYR